MLNDYRFYSDSDKITCATKDVIRRFKEEDAYDERIDNYGVKKYTWKDSFIVNINKVFVDDSSSILSSKEVVIYNKYTNENQILTALDLNDPMTVQLDNYLATILVDDLKGDSLCQAQ